MAFCAGLLRGEPMVEVAVRGLSCDSGGEAAHLERIFAAGGTSAIGRALERGAPEWAQERLAREFCSRFMERQADMVRRICICEDDAMAVPLFNEYSRYKRDTLAQARRLLGGGALASKEARAHVETVLGRIHPGGDQGA